MDTQQGLTAIWQRYRESTMRRLEVLESARHELMLQGQLPAELRAKAAGEAHNLAGSLGTFGLQKVARVAREIQLLFGGEATLTATDAERVTALLAELQVLLDEPLPQLVAAGLTTATGKKLLVLDADVELNNQLATYALRRGFEVVTAATIEEARTALSQFRPDVVTMEILLPTRKDGLDFLKQTAAQHPEITVVAVTRSFDFMDRVEVARWGGRGFLEKPLSPHDVLDFVLEILRRRQKQTARVLLVDDDAEALASLAELLESDGFDAHKIQDPVQFWRALEMISPDLVVMDVDIPEINGLDLCRTMRNDARWATVPVLFLTTHVDQVARLQGFDGGVDDFVRKDAGPEEIRARIRVRLERAAAQALHLRRDPLTGLLNRREATQEISRLLSLAARQGNHLSITMVDLDHFKSINDRFGHAAGDEVLRRAASKMQTFFRNEDVIARWGGEEFLVATYGMDSNLAAQRVKLLLEQFRQERFDFAQDFSVTFSAGIADFPTEKTLEAAVVRADGALYEAKQAGRNQVMSAAAGKGA